MHCYFVFIRAHANVRRLALHAGLARDFQRLRSVDQRPDRAVRVVYFEFIEDAEAAALRVREIRALRRRGREALIATMNPEWADLVAKC